MSLTSGGRESREADGPIVASLPRRPSAQETLQAAQVLAGNLVRFGREVNPNAGILYRLASRARTWCNEQLAIISSSQFAQMPTWPCVRHIAVL